MACNCCLSECNTCNPCGATPNPCNPCTTTVPPLLCAEECELPVYTNEGCYPQQKTSCVDFNGTADPCVPIAVDDNMNLVISNLVTYVKNTLDRLTAEDDSITITPIDDACDDKATIRVNISDDAGNSIELRDDGLFVDVGDVTGLTSVAILDSTSIDLSGNGQGGTPLSASIILDDSTGGNNNIAEITGDGLYVPPTVLLLKDTDTTSYDGDGTTTALGFDVTLDPENTNIITSSPSGLKAQYEYIQDLEDNLTQHFIFEVPPLRDLTYTTDAGVKNALKVVLGDLNRPYATDYSASNPNVKVFWDDTATIENSLDNVAGPDNGLDHTYPGLSDFYRNGYVKGYNGDHLIRLWTGYGTGLSGFKFIKGGEHMLEIFLGGYAQGYSGVCDFKGLFNLTAFWGGTNAGVSTDYKDVAPLQGFTNLQDLLSMSDFRVSGYVPVGQDFIIPSPTLGFFSMGAVRNANLVQLKNKETLSIAMDASGMNILDLQGSKLTNVQITNCGDYFQGYINKMIFRLNQVLYAGYGTPVWVQGSGIFDFVKCSVFTLTQTNGVYDDGIRTVKPFQILFPDFPNDGVLRYIDGNQDFIKDECVLSLNNNGLTKGSMDLIGNNLIHSFGENYLWDYYNPTYDPLNGTSTKFTIGITAGAVSTFSIGGTGSGIDSGGYSYNSIPTFTKVSGPGSGFTYEVSYLLQPIG